jgi:hypothetical protein
MIRIHYLLPVFFLFDLLFKVAKVKLSKFYDVWAIELNLGRNVPLGQMTSYMNFQFDIIHHLTTRGRKPKTRLYDIAILDILFYPSHYTI